MAIDFIRYRRLFTGFAGFFLAVWLVFPAPLAAGDGSPWSYDDQDAYDYNKSRPKQRTFNPWSGAGNGPQASTPDERFHYGNERQLQPSPRLEDLYPKSGVPSNSGRPWGSVPKQFEEQENGYSSRWYDQETAQDYRSKGTNEWPEKSDDWEQQEEYDTLKLRSYGDRYRSPYGPLFNDYGNGYDSWQNRHSPWGNSSINRDRSFFPRY